MATKAKSAPKAAAEPRSMASKRIRKIFGNIHEVSEMPNLIEVQRESYEQFLRSRPQDNYVSGLEKDRKSTRLNSSHANISYAVFCLKKIITCVTGYRT